MPKKEFMINRCKYINAALTICHISHLFCKYMADPESCQNYDEDIDRSYIDSYKGKSPSEIAHVEAKGLDMEVEGLDEFAKRTIDELKRIGVEVEVESANERIEEPPDWF